MALAARALRRSSSLGNPICRGLVTTVTTVSPLRRSSSLGNPICRGLVTTVSSLLDLGPDMILVPCQKIIVPYHNIITPGGLAGSGSANICRVMTTGGIHGYFPPPLSSSQARVVELVSASEVTGDGQISLTNIPSLQEIYFLVERSTKARDVLPAAAAPKVGGCFAGWEGGSWGGFGSCAGGTESALICLNLDGVVVKPPGGGSCGENYRSDCLKAIENCDQKLNLLLLLGKKDFATVNPDNEVDLEMPASEKMQRVGLILWNCFTVGCAIYPVVVGAAAVYSTGLSPLELLDFAQMHHDDDSQGYKDQIANYRKRLEMGQTEIARQKAEAAKENYEKTIQDLVNARHAADIDTEKANKAIEEASKARDLACKTSEEARKAGDVADRARVISEKAKCKAEADKSAYETQTALYEAETARVEAEVQEAKKNAMEAKKKNDAAKEAKKKNDAAKEAKKTNDAAKEAEVQEAKNSAMEANKKNDAAKEAKLKEEQLKAKEEPEAKEAKQEEDQESKEEDQESKAKEAKQEEDQESKAKEQQESKRGWLFWRK